MSTKEKLLRKLLSKPRDFRFEEAVTLLNAFDFPLVEGDGSRVSFASKKTGKTLDLHKPHGRENALLAYQIKSVISFLEKEDLL